jgi:hypothetical protein
MTHWKYSLVEEAEALATFQRQREQRAAQERRARDLGRTMLLVIFGCLLATLALVCTGCDGDPLGYPTAVDASPDAGAATVDVKADTGVPCHDLALGTELTELPTTASGHVIFNNRCAKACVNTAGGWTCILPGGVTVDCEACQ